MSTRARGGLALVVVAACAVVTARAEAQCLPTSSQRPALCRNDFVIDLYQGPVLAPLAVTGLGGAYAAIADGVEGLGQNAAASAVRPAWSYGWFDYDLALSASFPGAFGKTDFDNRGQAGLNSVTFFYTLGAILQFGHFGVGVSGDFQRFALPAEPATGVPGTVVQIGRLHASIAYSFLGDQLVVGGGLRGVRATADTLPPDASPDALVILKSENVLSLLGVSPEMGLLIRPDYAPFRVGATYRRPVDAAGQPGPTASRDLDGVYRAGGLPLPTRVHWPWELELGVALSAGPRPLNPKWIDPHEQEGVLREEIELARRTRRNAQEADVASIEDPARRRDRERDLALEEKYIRAEEERRLDRLAGQLLAERRARFKNWPRDRILVVAEVLVTGSTDKGISPQSFLRREDVPSGLSTSVQPRLGLEGEPVPGTLVARVGTYVEPSRYQIAPQPGVLAGARQHFTFGGDVRLFSWDVFGLVVPTEWRLTVAADLAPRYQNLGLGIGTWH